MTIETFTRHLIAENLRWQPAALRHAHHRFSARKRLARLAPKGPVGFNRKPRKSDVFLTRTFSGGVRVKRDKSRSETDFGVFGSL